MAHPKPTLFFSFFFLFLLSHQIHARDSQFFSKFTNDNNNPKETTTTVVTPRNNDNQKQVDQQQEEPTFIPDTQNNGYGLYGHESGQFSPSETSVNEEHFTTTKTTTNGGGAAPYTTNSATPVSTYEPYTTPTTTTYYKPYTTPIGRPYRADDQTEEENDKYAYNNAQFYNNNNNENENENYNANKRNTNNGGGNDRSYNPERQGMSDTRFMENGKYFYDLNMEKNYDPNSYRNSRVVAEPRNNWYNNRENKHNNNNNYYGHNNNNPNDRSYETNNNSFEGYQNQNQNQNQFEDNYDQEP
ncbi:protein E6 [Humulus lupulus]|uniref:protein E6 n=1 Tax=Humulus lupulus TaxID=3486 RepID=UPI002B41632E|nr:protein E6 [Humulus lupulus]